MVNDGIKKYLAKLKNGRKWQDKILTNARIFLNMMMANDGIKKEQSIKLLLVIVEKNGSTLHTHNIILAHDFV